MIIKRNTWLIVSCVALFAGNSALAGYTELSIPDRQDYVFDNNGILYISTTGGGICRYDTHAATFLSPFVIGGTLGGIDLSPDGSTLAVADYSMQGANNRIHLVDASTGGSTPISFLRESLEGGTFMVAWGADNQVLITSNFNGSGWVPLRRYNPQTDTTTTVGSVRQSSMLTPSADRNTIAIVEANISSGPLRDYDVQSNSFQGSINTDWFTFEVAVDRDGDQFIVPTYYGAFVFDKPASTFEEKGVIGQYATHGPLAAVYSPVNDVFFTAEWSWTGPEHGVRVYDAKTLVLIDTLDAYPYTWAGNGAFGPVRMEISPDGRLLAVSVDGGTRLYDVSAYVPEPASLFLMVFAGIGLVGLRRFDANAKRISSR